MSAYQVFLSFMLYDAPEKYSYDVALSFPGELRSLAKALSDTLKTKSSGLRVFCETDTVGKSAEAVVSGYATQAILIVPFFLKQYGYSEFCQKEWYAIQSNWDIFHDRILPLRFDKTFPVYGLSDYIDLTASSSELAAIADQVLKKLDEIKQQWSKKPYYYFTGFVGPLVWNPTVDGGNSKAYVVRFLDGDVRCFARNEMEKFLVSTPLIGEFSFLNANLNVV